LTEERATGRRVDDVALSGRELAVLPLVCHGLTNDAIGHQLEITEGTAKAHVSSLLKKVGAVNRAELCAKAVALQIMKLPAEESD